MESNPESSTRSVPDSPIMEMSDATTQEMSASREAKEDAPGAKKSAPSLVSTKQPPPSAATSDAAAAAVGEARGSGSSGTRLVRF